MLIIYAPTILYCHKISPYTEILLCSSKLLKVEKIINSNVGSSNYKSNAKLNNFPKLNKRAPTNSIFPRQNKILGEYLQRYSAEYVLKIDCRIPMRSIMIPKNIASLWRWKYSKNNLLWMMVALLSNVSKNHQNRWIYNI